MSVRRLRAELKELRSRVEQQRTPVFVLVVHGEIKEQALKRMGIDADDPAVDVSFIDIFAEERDL